MLPLLLTAFLATAAPVGDSLPDPLAVHVSRPVSLRVDTIAIFPHGSLVGSKVLTVGDSLAYDWAEWFRDNVLHSRTTARAIRARLGFEEGDTLDSLRLVEGERNLREEHFLADAKISRVVLDDGRNLVQVETWDRWSTSVLSGITRSGGQFSWLLGLRESDLLGTGQDVGFSYNYTSLATSWTETYTHTAFLAPGGLLQVLWSEVSDGHDIVVNTGYPLRSRFQDWAWLVQLQDSVYDRRVLATPALRSALDGRYPLGWSEDSRLSDAPLSDWRTARASFARIWGHQTRFVLSGVAESQLDSGTAPLLAVRIDTTRLAAMRTDPQLREWLQQAPQRDDRRLGLSLTVQDLDYLRLRNFNQLKWTEDIPTGWSLTGTAMANVLSRGTVRDDGYLAAQASWTGVEGSAYGAATANWKSFFKDEQATAGSAAWKAEGRWLPGNGLQGIADATSQQVLGVPTWVSEISLGEDNGLPGFPARYLSGKGLFLTTAEIRWALPLEALTVAPALAVLGGAGRVSDEPSVWAGGPWREGVGFGIRLGMTRSPSAIVDYINLSHPLGSDAKLGWLLSFGAKQSL
jgi:hypothetical protein